MRLSLGVLVLLIAFAYTESVKANIVINGDFEDNTAVDDQFNMSNATFNATIADATAFGPDEQIDLMDTTPTYGLAPQSGDWKLGIGSDGTINSGVFDAFSFDLSVGVMAGKTYSLSFYAHAVTESFSPAIVDVEVGLSTSATDFGTLVFAGSASSVAWTQLGGNFVAPINASYLTVRDPNSGDGWNHIDNFSLTVIPTPAALPAGLIALGALATRRRRRVA